MATLVPKTAELAARAARRAFVLDALRLGGRGLALGSCAGLLLIGADRLAGGLMPEAWREVTLWPFLVAVPAFIGAAAGSTMALVRRRHAESAALEVDLRLGLKERLSSGLALAERLPAEPGFEQIALRDAESAAGSVRLARAFPIAFEWTWGAWPVAVAGAVALALFVPRVQWRGAGESEAAEAAQLAQAAAEVQDASRAAREAVQETLADRGVMDVASADQLEQLESLERQLLSSTTGADEARVKAAATLESLAEELQAQGREDQAAHDALRDQLSGAEAPVEGAAAPLSEALRAGDMSGAQQAARDLLGKIAGMSEAEREALARDLEALAEKIKAAREADAEGRTDPKQPSGEAPPGDVKPEGVRDGDSPLRPPADVSSETDAERIREKLEQQGVPPDQSERLAEDIARQNKDRQAREQARRDSEQLQENLRDAARQAREPAADDASDRGKPSEPQAGKGDQRPSDRRPDEGQDRPGSGKQRGRDKGETDGEPNDEPKDAQDPSGKEPGANRPGVKTPGAPESTNAREGEQASKQRDEGERSGEQTGSKPDGSQRDGERGKEPGTSGPTGDQPADSPKEQPGEPGGQNPSEGRKEGQQRSGDSGEQSGSQPGSPAGAQPDPKAGEQGGEQAGDQTGEQTGQAQGERPSDPSKREGPNDRPGSRPSGEPQQPGKGGAGAKPDGQASQPGASPAAGAGEEGSSPDGQNQATDSPGSPSGQAPGRGGGFQKLQEQLDGLAERQQNAKQAPKVSRSLRDRAQRLLEQASKEDRQAMERWAEHAGKERAGRPDAPAQPWDGTTDLVDAREPASEQGADPSERVIAEWFSNQGVDRSGASSSRVMSDQIQRASEGAEQAIEQQAVPRRHGELIRRIFGRYTQRAKGQEPPPVDASDAQPAR